MSTRGFLGIKHDGTTIVTYNHSDSYPTWLGVRVAKFIQDADLADVARKFHDLTQVDPADKPTPEQLADLKARGFWSQVSTGDDWYSALRNAQSDLGAYLDAGYIPALNNSVLDTVDPYLEWGYLVDLDENVLVIYESVFGADAMRRTSIPIPEIRGEAEDLAPFDIEATMYALEYES